MEGNIRNIFLFIFLFIGVNLNAGTKSGDSSSFESNETFTFCFTFLDTPAQEKTDDSQNSASEIKHLVYSNHLTSSFRIESPSFCITLRKFVAPHKNNLVNNIQSKPFHINYFKPTKYFIYTLKRLLI